MTYYKLLIQQQTYNGSTYSDVGNVVDTLASYHMACQEMPFKHLPELKDLPKREWNDESGEDVYIPLDGVKFKAYDLDIKFLYVGTKEAISTDLKNFIDFLYGRNNGGAALMSMYDEYTKSGRRGMYVTKVDNELFFFNDASIDAIAEFKVTFRVTDPVTNVVLTNE